MNEAIRGPTVPRMRVSAPTSSTAKTKTDQQIEKVTFDIAPKDT
jgi:hypothetical protein